MSKKKGLVARSQTVFYEITDYFNRRAYGTVFLNLFEQMAHTITDEYLQNIHNIIQETGVAPSFEELIENVKALSDELALKSTWLREDYKVERGKRSPKLTKGCKRIINNAVNRYLTQSKILVAIKKQQNFSMPNS